MSDIEELLNKVKICNHIITNKYEYGSTIYKWEKCLDCSLDIFTNKKYISCSGFILNDVYFYVEYKVISYTLDRNKTISATNITKIIVIDETNLAEIIKFCKKYIDNLIFL